MCINCCLDKATGIPRTLQSNFISYYTCGRETPLNKHISRVDAEK